MKSNSQYPIPTVDELIGDEEQHVKQKKEKNKQKAGPQPSYNGLLDSLTTPMDYSVELFQHPFH